MAREILLDVLPAKFDDPMVLIKTTREERTAASSYSRVYPFKWDPPPDTLFMRATNLDLGVFGEDLERGTLQMIESRHTSPTLEAALGAQVSETLDALVALSERIVSPEDVSRALATGVWPDEPDKQRGAILQAAGFARCLLEAIRHALPDKGAVVWEYTGGMPTYDYP